MGKLPSETIKALPKEKVRWLLIDIALPWKRRDEKHSTSSGELEGRDLKAVEVKNPRKPKSIEESENQLINIPSHLLLKKQLFTVLKIENII